MTFMNPIIPGCYPDPSVCRVGEDYYLVSSTLEFFPGIPLFHSRNLVDWEQIGHVMNRPEELNIDTSDDGQGLCAPTIRFHDGVYYVLCTLVRRDGDGWFVGSFVCTATDPAGTWSALRFVESAPGMDPDLLFDDDGKVYWVANNFVAPGRFKAHRTIWLQEFDLQACQLKGERHILLDAADWLEPYGEAGCGWFEGPRLLKRGGWYYLIIAAGGIHWNHSVMAFRSRTLLGSYEACPHNPLLTHRDLNPEESVFGCVGHIDFVETPAGELWGTLQATRPYAGAYNLIGRETVLVPVSWKGEWPEISPMTGRLEKMYPAPAGGDLSWKPQAEERLFDDGRLGPAALFIRRPLTVWWDLASRPDWLRMALRPERLSDLACPAFIGRRVTHLDFCATVTVEVPNLSGEEEAGLAVYRSRREYFRLVILSAEDGRAVRLFARTLQDECDQSVAEMKVKSGPIRLRVDTTGAHYRFSVSAERAPWEILDRSFGLSCIATQGQDSCNGPVVGLFVGSNGFNSNSYADFSRFEYSGL